MTKETPELIAECWALLVEYIPRRDHIPAAEQLFTYLESVLDKKELAAIADLDSDLNEAYVTISKENNDYYEEDDFSTYDECDEDEE